MILGALALFIIDIGLAAGALAAMRYDWRGVSEGVPLAWALLLCAAAVLIHFVGVLVFAALSHGEMGVAPEITAGVSVAGGIVPALLYGWMLISAFGAALAGGHREPEPLSRDALRRALTFERNGHTDDAVKECLRVAAMFNDHPLPQLEAARMLESAGRYDESADRYRTIARKFRANNETWIAAATRLAHLLRFHLEEPEAAAEIERQIRTKRTPALDRAKRGKGQPDHAPRQPLQAAHGIDDPVLEKYKRQYREAPGNPRPLFGAASLLERQGEWEACTSMLRFAMDEFASDDAVWCEAAYRLGLVLERGIGDGPGATRLYREIIRRRPATDHRRLAHARLAILEAGEPAQD